MASSDSVNARRSTTLTLALSLLAASAAACDGDKKSTDAANSPEAEASPAGESADAAPAPIVGKPIEGEGGIAAVKSKPDDEPLYKFSVQKSDSYKAGEEAVVMLALVPKKDWHLNLEFPTKVKLEASEGLGLTKALLKQEDAATFAEAGFEFGVRFKPTVAGEGQVSGKIKFAVCQDEACSPQTEEIEFAVLVN
jgi:hypothetical protein